MPSKLTPKLVNIPLSVSGPHTNIRHPGATPVYHTHGVWSLNLYDIRGAVRFPDLNLEYEILPGYACLMPPETKRVFYFSKTGLHRVLHFQLPDAEKDGPASPHIFDMGKHAKLIQEMFDRLLSVHPHNPERTKVILWDILWALAEDCPQPDANEKHDTPRPVILAAEYINSHLAGKISVSEIVQRSGMSHNHLTRIFKKHFGRTIVGYIRTQRTKLARDLIRQTDMPIKAVAIEVGLPDLHQFNKTMRMEFGVPPRDLRVK